MTSDLCLQGAASDEEGGHPDAARSSVLQHGPLRGGPAGVQGGRCPAATEHRHLASSGENTHTRSCSQNHGNAGTSGWVHE